MEATGKYSLELSAWFTAHAATTAPAIINPRLSKSYSASLAITNRTDKADARTLARFGAERTPAAYAPAAPEWAQLRDLTRYRQALVEMRQAEKSRAEETSCSAVVRQTQNRRIKQLDRDIAKLDKSIKALVQQTADMKRDVQCLDTIAGVGPVTATTVLAELGDLRRFNSARQMTAFAGLAPTCHDSGTSVRKKSHVSKSGSAHVRRILYLAALAATRGQNDFADTYRRLTEQGKMKMVALVAVMRKILVVMRAVLISKKQYQPHYKNRSMACG
jgi:transposase